MNGSIEMHDELMRLEGLIKPWITCSLDERIERWQQCQRVLENLPPHEREKHFDMGTWGDVTECGTIACAAGHCGMDPWFIERHFQMIYFEDPDGALGAIDADLPDPQLFFGVDGTSRIFLNTTPRPVEAVVEEVKAHIKWLDTPKGRTSV